MPVLWRFVYAGPLNLPMQKKRMCVGHINLARGYRGGERQTQLLIEGLSALGWSQKLIARSSEELAKRCVSIDGLELIEVRGNILSATLALKDIALVHVHEGRSVQAGFLNRALRGIPYLITRRVQKGPRHTRPVRLMYGGAAAIVAISEAISESMAALDPKLVCRVIPSASSGLTADPDRVQEIRESLGAGFIVGHIGGLVDSHKGQRQIIAIADRIRAATDSISFVMVGSGRDEGMLKGIAAGMSNVFFTGQVDNVGDYLAALDAFIYPSRHEGLGSILLDALEFGLPLIATNVGGIPEIVEDGSNGFLCEVDDVGAMSEAILELSRDPGLRARIAEVNRKKAEQYSPGRMTGRYAELYQRLLGSMEQEKAIV